MRTMVDLDADTERALRQLPHEHGRSVSEVVNELIRRGLTAEEAGHRFEPRTRPLGIRIDVSGTADSVDRLDGPRAR
ncbi:MAG: hypothetical protein ACRCSN_06795 [Dermatophilaceae bacterium]